MISTRHSTMPDSLLMAACLIAIGAFLINQIWDLDIWWHITIGRDILAHHAIPVTDRFTAAAFGRPYHDSQWLFQVVMALADRAAGIVGVQVMMILGWSAVFWFSWRTIAHWVSSPVSYLLLFLAAMTSVERFDPRPEIITLLMITLFWWLFQQRKYESTKELLLFGLLEVIWANSHGLFVIGPFMAGCYWLAAGLQQMRGEKTDFIQLSRLLGILFVATLAMPYGWEGWRFALLLVTETGPNAPEVLKEIGELAPTFGAENRSGVSFWFFAALLVTTITTIIPLALRRQVSLPRLLIIAGLFAAAMTGRRNMPLFAIVAAPFIAENLYLLFPQGIIRSTKIWATITVSLALAMLCWTWYPLSGNYYLRMGIASRSGWGATPSFYPYDLPRILERSHFNGQIYNSNNIGGFYLYHNYPERLPFTDGRFEVYDTKILEAIDEAPGNPAIWSRMINTYDIKGLLLQHASREAESLLPMLRSQDDWRLVYFDHAVSFWMRSDTPQLPPAIDLTTALLPPEPARAEDCFMLNLFLSKLDAGELKLQNLQRAIKFDWNTEAILTEIGQAQIRLKRFEQAEETLNQLLRQYPNNLYALNELGFLAYYYKHDLIAAESLLRRALEVAPDDPGIRNNYLGVKAAMERSATNRAIQGDIQ